MTDFAPLNALIFACLGLLVYLAALAIAIKVAPFDVWKQIVTERNAAAAAAVGAIALGMAWIIAATMH
jgi:putative membrane protein